MKFLKTFLLLSLISASLTGFTQVKLPFTNNDLRTNLQAVISDFPKQLSGITADIKNENPQTVEYATSLNFKGAEENTVTKYIGPKPVYSWQATLLTAEDFEEAAKKYKWLCNQLKTMTLSMQDGYGFTLDGKYEPAQESKKFASSIFELVPAAINLQKLKVEASMQYYFPEWKVQVTVFQKEREDHERGQTKD